MSQEYDKQAKSCCRNCGTPTGPVLLGSDELWTCTSCEAQHIGKPEAELCHCGAVAKHTGTINPEDVLPVGMCQNCSSNEEGAIKDVEAGGAYWRCSDCGMSGALTADHEASKLIREKTGIKPPEPVGIELDKEHGCPFCNAESA
jgi:ribosomal protein L37AE/L43A